MRSLILFVALLAAAKFGYQEYVYRSAVVDRSMDKIMALERATARRELAGLQERLRPFETRYQMSSEDFYRRFRAGALGDAMELVEWSVFYEMWDAVRARLEGLEADVTS